MSLLNMTAVHNHNNGSTERDNFENTREEIVINQEEGPREQREKTPKGQKRSKRPIELITKAVVSERRNDESKKTD